jgi:hypothetical protein
VCELAVQKEFYLTCDKVSALQTGDVEHPTRKQLGKNAIVACSQNYDQGLELADSTKLAETVFELDCLDSTRLGTYSGMWHVYGLSSVLRAPLQSIYPNFTETTSLVFTLFYTYFDTMRRYYSSYVYIPGLVHIHIDVT